MINDPFAYPLSPGDTVIIHSGIDATDGSHGRVTYAFLNDDRYGVKIAGEPERVWRRHHLERAWPECLLAAMTNNAFTCPLNPGDVVVVISQSHARYNQRGVVESDLADSYWVTFGEHGASGGVLVRRELKRVPHLASTHAVPDRFTSDLYPRDGVIVRCARSPVNGKHGTVTYANPDKGEHGEYRVAIPGTDERSFGRHHLERVRRVRPRRP
jgi:hypothetical protein